MTKKYTLVKSDTIINCEGKKLFRIKAAVAIAALGISKGDLGGYIESEQNLSQVSGNAWISVNAQVSGDAQVSGNAQVYAPIICATRTDGYTFCAAHDQHYIVRIIAGCRYFTPTEARAHWSATRGGTKLGDESLALIDHLERMAALQGWPSPVAAE